jgi:putative transposase
VRKLDEPPRVWSSPACGPLENLNHPEVENPPKRSLYMTKSRFSEAQIVGILKEVEMGAKVGETCRKHGVSEPTYYKWKSQFSGMTVSHLSQLRQLQDENAKLKRMYADLALMHHALKDVVDRKL